ncbi:MAG TPA: hypothetical protein VLS87_02215 [Woeseiaceae bacterium]|nr:hypothetical protein [Woeseiaceae bacterium]
MKYLRWIGLALSLLGIGFVVVQLGAYAGDLGEFRPSLLQAALLMVLALVYGASNVALAVAWRDLLEHCGAPSGVRWAVHVFGVTQLAKYIPGNFFHLASRQTIGMSDGHEAMPLLKSAVWEFAAIMSSAAVFGLWLGPLLVQGFSYTLGGALFVAAVAIVSLGAQRYFSAFVMRAVLWYVAFLVLSGLLFYATLQLLIPETNLLHALPGICSAYVIAWLAGAITPGAPAGIGIREVVMFALLQAVVAESDLLVAIVLNRAVTAGGDTLFYVFAAALGKRR